MDKANGTSPQEIGKLVTRAGVSKARLGWLELMVKSFLGGVFISIGGLFDVIVAGGAVSLRANNPSIATLIAAFTFPIGFVLVILTNVELVTSNMFIMMFTTLQRRTSVYDLARNWIVSYIFNIAGSLFFAGFLAYWSNSLSTDAEKSYAVTQAEMRVNIGSYWSVNFLRGVGCNWLVGLAFFLATASKEYISKIFSIWIPIWAFVALGYQHSIANYFLIPIGMFYGADFSVGEFIYKNEIPVSLGNILGGAFFTGCVFWFLYGRNDEIDNETGQPANAQKNGEKRNHAQDRTGSGETLAGGSGSEGREGRVGGAHRGEYDASHMV